MCAQYTVYSEEEIIEMRRIIDEISKRFGDQAVKTGIIRRTDTAPVLTIGGHRLAPVPASFGFPKWWGGGGVIVNARRETALDKAVFSKPLLSRRCVVPSTGFLEGAHASALERQMSMFPMDAGEKEGEQKASGPKVQLLFNRPGESMLYMAGMLGTFSDDRGGVKDAFCILTTQAKHAIAKFHDRMPVILSPDEREDWINSESFMREVLARDGQELVWRLAG